MHLRMYIFLLAGGVFYICLLGSLAGDVVQGCFLFIDLSSGCLSFVESGELKCPTIIVELSVSPLNSVNICFVFFLVN